MTQPKFRCYQCDEDECNVPDKQLSSCETEIYCWKSTLREDDGREVNSRGCIDQLKNVRLVCNSRVQMSNSRYRTECCTNQFCNNGIFPILEPLETPINADEGISTSTLTLAIITSLLTLGFIIIAVASCYRIKRSSRKKRKVHQQDRQPVMKAWSSLSKAVSSSDRSSPELKTVTADDGTIKEYIDDQTLTNGSGSGKPLLIQHTLSKEIPLVEILSTGNFGQQIKFWRGIWQGKSVMVKVYSPRLESQWTHETEVYTKLLSTKHDNILKYVGSDTTHSANSTQLWIVTHYHPNGSLAKYLKETILDQDGMLKACLSLTAGLLYLHTEMTGAKSKLPMAHRNLSSKNVFVKNDGNCVIGSFEHAVTQELLGEASFLKHVSRRYMSPELLKPTFEHEIWSLEGFQLADIYCLALIFWEICRRSGKNKDDVLPYEAPFSEWLVNSEREPTVTEMRKLILVEQRRPVIPDNWCTDTTMTALGSMIQECWNTKAEARQSLLQIKKTLVKLSNN